MRLRTFSGLDIAKSGTEVLGLDESDLEESSDADDDDIESDGSGEDEDETSTSKRQKQYKRLERERTARAEPLSDDDEGLDSNASEDENDLSRWGPNKRAYYNTNDADQMESDSEIDEEQARRLELQEVKKLQTKSRRGMEDTDFGLGEADEIGGAEEGGRGLKEREKRRKDLDEAVSEKPIPSAPASTIASTSELPSDPVARASLLVQLHKDSPETIALAGDYADAVSQLLQVDSLLRSAEKSGVNHEGLGMHHMHYQALYTYVTTLTFYFHLRSSPKYSTNPQALSTHPILARLLQLKEGLSTMEELGFDLPTEEEEQAEEDEVEDDLDESMDMLKEKWPVVYGSEDEDEELGDLESDELAGLLADEKENGRRHGTASRVAKLPRAAATSDATNERSGDTAVAPLQSRKKKAPRRALEAPLSGLAADDSNHNDILGLASYTSKRPSTGSVALDVSSGGDLYGEATALSAAELADKAAKKKSLRFYTGQMDAKEARRGSAARERMGGDTDIPYRDRERSRIAVEQTKAAKENRANGTSRGQDASLDDSEWGEADTRDWRDVMGAHGESGATSSKTRAPADSDDDDDGYYDLVTRGRQDAKRAKKETYDTARDEGRIIEDAELEPGSHRAINRQISTNRGLTPHRKQDRNLRVKKRKKYEKAQKKLSSTRAVYKGGQSALQGGYQGESSGINVGIAKSRRFAN